MKRLIASKDLVSQAENEFCEVRSVRRTIPERSEWGEYLIFNILPIHFLIH